ncbi:MAG TPA: hypothetical protein VJ698_22205 [Noviherbaspirillum sp.]|uniref:hypothetical protein n=1 Tax=Noviherbaspirillum sp. TaxID=1926288 RepID=UPI002B46A595|nr:hypothetical protein [Noviherbaspirillum sp.]HJV88199.1 hypothetical protein [Noviherbaspirillum sp.]
MKRLPESTRTHVDEGTSNAALSSSLNYGHYHNINCHNIISHNAERTMDESRSIELSDEQGCERERRVNSKIIDACTARRPRVVALAADDLWNREIAGRHWISKNQEIAWRWRFVQSGRPAIENGLPRSGCRGQSDAAEIVPLAMQTMPEGGAR